MRVLFTTWAWPSHLYPMVPFGWALQAAGHDVRVATTSGLVDAVNRAGLTAVDIGPDPDLAGMATRDGLAAWHSQKRWPRDWWLDPRRLNRAQVDLLRALGGKQIRMAEVMADGVVTVAQRWRPDLIIHDAVTFAGAVAGAVVGVPTVATMWGSTAVPRNERELGTDQPLPGYVKLFEPFGVEPRWDPAFWLDPCPLSLRVPGPHRRVSYRYVPYNGPGSMPTWVLDPVRRPRVCLTWGVTAGRIGAGGGTAALSATLAAIAKLGVEVVLAVTPAQLDALGDLPQEVVAAGPIPLYQVLPTCAVVVHQGGGGTTMTASISGTPQVIVSPRPEQMMTGDRLEDVGAGLHLAQNDFGEEIGEAIAEAVARILDDPGFRERALALREEMLAQPSPAEIVPQLVALATG
ncbi:MAG TPA: nucleotide disphospho-sugar-binding domain-containing protein [Micromonospora sp.]